MRFTVTPLGGARSDVGRVVNGIVRYLQPLASTVRRRMVRHGTAWKVRPATTPTVAKSRVAGWAAQRPVRACPREMPARTASPSGPRRGGRWPGPTSSTASLGSAFRRVAIAGQQDLSAIPEALQAIADGIAGCRYVLVDPGTHMMPMEQPDALAGALLEFRRDVESNAFTG